MRTTVDLPEDVRSIVESVAHDKSQSLSDAVVALIRRGLSSEGSQGVSYHSLTGFPTIRTGRPITTEDVRSLEDDE